MKIPISIYDDNLDFSFTTIEKLPPVSILEADLWYKRKSVTWLEGGTVVYVQTPKRIDLKNEKQTAASVWGKNVGEKELTGIFNIHEDWKFFIASYEEALLLNQRWEG